MKRICIEARNNNSSSGYTHIIAEAAATATYSKGIGKQNEKNKKYNNNNKTKIQKGGKKERRRRKTANKKKQEKKRENSVFKLCA